jgi:hypothetical protein
MDATPKPLEDVLFTGCSDGRALDRAQWTTSVDAVSTKGGLRYHAFFFRSGIFACRMVLSRSLKDQATAEKEFERRLKAWSAEYESGGEKLPAVDARMRASDNLSNSGDGRSSSGTKMLFAKLKWEVASERLARALDAGPSLSAEEKGDLELAFKLVRAALEEVCTAFKARTGQEGAAVG